MKRLPPKGIPPEPIQLGFVEIDNLILSDVKQKSWSIKPPVFAPLTKFDTMQTGITESNLANAKASKEIFNLVELICTKHDYIFVAQNANYELAICKRFYEQCENLSKAKFVDTIKLAKLAFPNEKSYKLDNIAKLLDVKIPLTRHTALTDCIITAQVFIKLVSILQITVLQDLLKKACINNVVKDSKQLTLF